MATTDETTMICPCCGDAVGPDHSEEMIEAYPCSYCADGGEPHGHLICGTKAERLRKRLNMQRAAVSNLRKQVTDLRRAKRAADEGMRRAFEMARDLLGILDNPGD